jgi:gluconolactonase
MRALETAHITVVKTGLSWGEGPVVHAGGVVFSDIGRDRLHLWRDGGVSVFREPSRRANGNTVDAEGRLISCEHGSRQVTRTELDGSITVLADRFEGARLNSPNDVVVARDGGVWFTDPPYGLLRGDSGPDARQDLPSGVYRVDPVTREVGLMIGLMDKPNGLAFSRDERSLYVSDTGHSNRAGGNRHIFRFDMLEGRPRNLTVFREISPFASDGFKVDAAGLIWTSAGDGVHVLGETGNELGRISLGEMATNLCFLPADGPAGVFVTTPTRAVVVALGGSGGIDGLCRP